MEFDGNINPRSEFQKLKTTMVEANPMINPLTGRQWDLNSLMAKVLELQEALVQAQERNITLTAQARELERIARDAEDLKVELTNQGQLLADKSRENKHLHQELSRMAGILEAKNQEVEELKAAVVDVQHQLKTCQSERDLLAVMLTDAENAARQARRSEGVDSGSTYQTGTKDQQQGSGWLKYLKPKN